MRILFPTRRVGLFICSGAPSARRRFCSQNTTARHPTVAQSPILPQHLALRSTLLTSSPSSEYMINSDLWRDTWPRRMCAGESRHACDPSCSYRLPVNSYHLQSYYDSLEEAGLATSVRYTCPRRKLVGETRHGTRTAVSNAAGIDYQYTATVRA